jgi:beta-galactosidase/beta-glucuronidase
MGNGPGALDQYEALAHRHPRLHGGFVWEWRDHGLLARTTDGTPYYASGPAVAHRAGCVLIAHLSAGPTAFG